MKPPTGAMMDISAFDFELDEVRDVLAAIAEIAASVELEPRPHQIDEEDVPVSRDKWEPIHEPRSAPTFTIQFRPHWGNGVVGSLHAFETETGLETVFDSNGVVRLRHRRSD